MRSTVLSLLLLGLCVAPAPAQSAASPTPDQIYYKVLDRLRALPDPPYIDFTFHVTASALHKSTDDLYHVVFRSDDGMVYQHPIRANNRTTPEGDTHADTIEQSDMAPDFFLRMQRTAGTKNATPGIQHSIFGFSPDTFATPEPEEIDGKKLITAVRATYNSRYAITLAGTERTATCESAAYHLKLSPRRDQDKNILRDLWVDSTTYDICKMSIAQIVNNGIVHAPVSAIIDFQSVGPYRLATHLAGEGHMRFLFASASAIVEMNFDDITFPQTEPAWMFDKTLRNDRVKH